MLPDLRIVIVAVLSTFVLTVGVGFYTSSRLITETKRNSDFLVAMEETPVNRIALSWPEPSKQPEPLALDFAVSAKALRNPVRDVTNEQQSSDQRPQPVRTTATDAGTRPAEPVAKAAPEKFPDTPEATPAPTPSPAVAEAPVPVPAAIETPKASPVIAPSPEIRIAVQYPPTVPSELQAPAAPVVAEPAPPTAVAEPAPPPVAIETPVSTGSIAEQPKAAEPVAAEPLVVADDPAPAVASEPEVRVASLPEATKARLHTGRIPLPRPAPKVRSKKAAPKKPAPRRATVVRRTAAIAQPAVSANATPFSNFMGNMGRN